MNKFLKSKIEVKFKQEQFDKQTTQDAINQLAYGVIVDKLIKKGKQKHLRFFYIFEDNNCTLQWISPKKQFTKSRINLGDIKDISRDAHWTSLKGEKKYILSLHTSSTMIVLEFKTERERELFQCGIQHFAVLAIQQGFLEKKKDQVKHMAQALFQDADKDGSKQLSFDETKRLLQELHINIDRKYLKKLFDIYDINQNGEIDRNEFTSIMRDISKKQELYQIFLKYCPEHEAGENDEEKLMTIEQFQKFQKEEQNQIFSRNEIVQIFSFTQPSHSRTASQIIKKVQDEKKNESQINVNISISFYEFSNWIFSLENSIYSPQLEELHQSMDQPLSDYFVNSSHNTYLLANQLTSESSCQAYINAFLRGCRCVEIDTWNGENGDPIVYHGHTLTSKIFFKDVVQVIDEYGFRISPYPIILSFENHCNLEQSKRIAYHLKNILKDKLYILPENYNNVQYYTSPNQLKNKIIVKSKGRLLAAISKDIKTGFISESDEDGDEDTDSQSDHQIFEDIKNIIPDFTQLEQFNINLQSGKKKSIILEKKNIEMLQGNLKNVNDENILKNQNLKVEYSSSFPQNMIKFVIDKPENSNNIKIVNSLLSENCIMDISKETEKIQIGGRNFQKNNNNKNTKTLPHIHFAQSDISHRYEVESNNFSNNQGTKLKNKYFSEINDQRKEINGIDSCIIKGSGYKNEEFFEDQQYLNKQQIIDNLKSYIMIDDNNNLGDNKLNSFNHLEMILNENESEEDDDEFRKNQFENILSQNNNYPKNIKISENIGDMESVNSYDLQSNINHTKNNSESQNFQDKTNKKQKNSLFIGTFSTGIVELNKNISQISIQKEQSLENNHKIEPSITIQQLNIPKVESCPYQQESLQPESQVQDNQLLSVNYESNQQEKSEKKSISKSMMKECKELLSITTQFGCKINLHDKNNNCWLISSLSEIKYHRLFRKFPKDLVEYTKKSFIRLYPSALRVDSSNYDPIKGFLSGCQMIALNFQTNDIPMLLNQSIFQQNGGVNSGYVLKPQFMLHDAKKTYVPNTLKKIIKTVKIQIISGQQLRPENYENDTFDIVDPYVQIFVKGTDFDEKSNPPQLTSIIQDNGFHPVWDSKEFTFNFTCPELAMIVFRAMDSDVGSDTHLGSFAIPVDAIRGGYRVVPLRAMKTLELREHSYILVKIQMQENKTRNCLTTRKSLKK